MKDFIQIDRESGLPIYLQLVQSITGGIEDNTLKIGDAIPSINHVSDHYQIARGTVTKAYDELQSRGIIASRHGKGFFVASTQIRTALKIFVLFDEINAYKEVLYAHFIKGLGEECVVNIFFYHHNAEVFESLILNHLGVYNFYVIMAHFDKDMGGVVSKIPRNQLLLLNQDINSLQDVPAVYQDFEKDIYQALVSGLPLLRKYTALRMVLSKKSFQYVPAKIIMGFRKFCSDYGFKYDVYNDLEAELIRLGEVFIVFTEKDLIELVKYIHQHQLTLGQDLGLISYDDTPMKEVLEKGITVISTDFAKLGETAASMIKNRTKEKTANPSSLICRHSL